MAATTKTRIYVTIDTETSLGGAWRNPANAPLSLERTVFGNVGGRFYGIPLIMDILEEHGFRGTFFTEMFCSYFVGQEEVAKACNMISTRGHDCQLHLHPVYRFYCDYTNGKARREMDLMFQLTRDEQHELIAEGTALFRQIAGKPARAYRAGGYAGSEVTLSVLHQNGIVIDSSYNLAYLGQTCGFTTPDLNAPAAFGAVCEFPVTVFQVAGATGYKPLEISAVSVWEIVATVRALRNVGCYDVVLVLHSSSLLKNTGLRFEQCSPDRVVIHRFRRLCAVLQSLRDEVEVRTLGEMEQVSVPLPQPQVVPTLGWFQPAVRKMVQAVNRLPW
jgi:hypothetical protein